MHTKQYIYIYIYIYIYLFIYLFFIVGFFGQFLWKFVWFSITVNLIEVSSRSKELETRLLVLKISFVPFQGQRIKTHR